MDQSKWTNHDQKRNQNKTAKTASTVNEVRMKRWDAGWAVLPGPGNWFDALKHDSCLMSEKRWGGLWKRRGGVKNMNLSSPFTSTVQSGCSQFKPLSCPGIDHWQKRNPSDGILTSNMSIRTQHHRTINAASWTLQSSAANSCRWQDLVGAWLINPGFNSLMLS